MGQELFSGTEVHFYVTAISLQLHLLVPRHRMTIPSLCNGKGSWSTLTSKPCLGFAWASPSQHNSKLCLGLHQ